MKRKLTIVAAIASAIFELGLTIPVFSQTTPKPSPTRTPTRTRTPARTPRRSACTATLTATERNSRINLRQTPGRTSLLRTVARSGDRVTIVRGSSGRAAVRRDRQGVEWVQVELRNGRRGWVRRDFVSAFRC